MNADPRHAGWRTLIEEVYDLCAKSRGTAPSDRVFFVHNAVEKLTAALEAAMEEIERLKDGN